ncbi:MAG: GNAT family N-acetyltransferase [Alphaproteobacteria bacterium]
MTIVLREASADDDEICGRIVGAAAGGAVYAERLPHARAIFADTSPLTRAGRHRLIATLDGKPVGFADFRDDGHIKYLFVDPAAQGRGAGATLVDAVQARTGAIAVHVLALNDVGIAWYLRRGFRVVGGWIEPLRDTDAVWLRLVRGSAVP